MAIFPPPDYVLVRVSVEQAEELAEYLDDQELFPEVCDNLLEKLGMLEEEWETYNAALAYEERRKTDTVGLQPPISMEEMQKEMYDAAASYDWRVYDPYTKSLTNTDVKNMSMKDYATHRHELLNYAKGGSLKQLFGDHSTF